MASLFTLRALIGLATKIGANPAKAISRSNISFLGKGPTTNPLFQRPLAGLEGASVQNLGDPKKLFGAIEDAVGWAKDGKLNSIQKEILGRNLTGIDKILHPPVLPTLPTATVTKLPTRGTGIKGLKKPSDPFMGWKPKVVPKATNIPASKINHQMIADKYGIDVELIRGKDWIEVLEVIKNLGLRHGGLARILEV